MTDEVRRSGAKFDTVILSATISAARNGAKLHPLPEEGETMEGTRYECAQAYGIAADLAGEVERLQALLEIARLQAVIDAPPHRNPELGGKPKHEPSMMTMAIIGQEARESRGQRHLLDCHVLPEERDDPASRYMRLQHMAKFVIRIARFDTYCCRVCDIWLESKCSDAACDLCRERPTTPGEAIAVVVLKEMAERQENKDAASD